MKAGLTLGVFLVGIFFLTPEKLIGQNTPATNETTQEVTDLIERKVEINKEVFASQYYAIQLYYGITPLQKTF